KHENILVFFVSSGLRGCLSVDSSDTCGRECRHEDTKTRRIFGLLRAFVFSWLHFGGRALDAIQAYNPWRALRAIAMNQKFLRAAMITASAIGWLAPLPAAAQTAPASAKAKTAPPARSW